MPRIWKQLPVVTLLTVLLVVGCSPGLEECSDLFQGGDYSACRKGLTKILAQDQDNISARELLIRVELADGRCREALVHLMELAKANHATIDLETELIAASPHFSAEDLDWLGRELKAARDPAWPWPLHMEYRLWRRADEARLLPFALELAALPEALDYADYFSEVWALFISGEEYFRLMPLLSVFNPADFWAEADFWGRLSYDPGNLTELYEREPDNCTIVTALAYHKYRNYMPSEALNLMLEFEEKGYELKAPDIWSDVKLEILLDLALSGGDESVLTPEAMASIHPYHLLRLANGLPPAQAEIVLAHIADNPLTKDFITMLAQLENTPEPQIIYQLPLQSGPYFPTNKVSLSPDGCWLIILEGQSLGECTIKSVELATGKATNLGRMPADTGDEIEFQWKPDGSAVQFGNLLYTPGGLCQEFDLPPWGWMNMQWLDNESLLFTRSTENYYESLAAYEFNPLTGETQLLSEQYQQWVAANGTGGLVTAKEVLNGVVVTREDGSSHYLNKDYRPTRLLPEGTGISAISKRFHGVQWIYTFADSNTRPLLFANPNWDRPAGGGEVFAALSFGTAESHLIFMDVETLSMRPAGVRVNYYWDSAGDVVATCNHESVTVYKIGN